MTTIEQKKSVWRYIGEQGSEPVLLQTSEGERFILPAAEFSRALRAADKRIQMVEQVGTLLGRLSDWLTRYQDKIDRAYFHIEPAGAKFVVVTRGKAFDQELNTALALIDMEIANEESFELVDMHSMAIPYCPDDNVASFIDTKNSLVARIAE